MTERGRDGATGAQGERGPEGKRGRDTNNPAVWALAFALVLCFSLLAVAVHQDRSAVATATRALCSEKLDITTRLKQTNDFIRRMDGSKSITIGNVTYLRADLLRSRNQLRQEVGNLKDIPCR